MLKSSLAKRTGFRRSSRDLVCLPSWLRCRSCPLKKKSEGCGQVASRSTLTKQGAFLAQTGKVYLHGDPHGTLELPLLGSELVCLVAPSRHHIPPELETGAQPLIPARPLEAGEQYRFHFDMTKCIGCKCCVVACNEQNGNPAAINWRRVGEVEGGYYPNTQRYHLSMGCNHCLEPSCLIACPVEAYTKDPITGVVLHSADTCIGCQYCVWNCSYGVPQYNPERGVVGKCDMCHNRLGDGGRSPEPYAHARRCSSLGKNARRHRVKSDEHPRSENRSTARR